MRRLIAIAAMVVTAAACGSTGDGGSTEAVPDQGATMVPAADVPGAPGDQEAESVPTPEAAVVDADASTAMIVAAQTPTISLPAPSGDPELDALGAELAGLEQQLLALDAASIDLGGTP